MLKNGLIIRKKDDKDKEKGEGEEGEDGEEGENGEGAENEATNAAKDKHPCVAQYGSCLYGENCMLKDYPADTCIHHFCGSCIYGDHCKKRHFIDGVDIAASRKASQRNNDRVVIKDGQKYETENITSSVQVAYRVSDSDASNTNKKKLMTNAMNNKDYSM